MPNDRVVHELRLRDCYTTWDGEEVGGIRLGGGGDVGGIRREEGVGVLGWGCVLFRFHASVSLACFWCCFAVMDVDR